MKLTHNLRQTTLKLRWASNFAKLPQNSRNISRTGQMLLRVSVVLIIAIAFVYLTNRREVGPFDVKQPGAKLGVKNIRKASLVEAWNFWQRYLKSKDRHDWQLTNDKIREVLAFDAKNKLALKILEELNLVSKSDLGGEIKRLRKILEVRADYAEAWARLAILYEQAGENELASEARAKADSP